MDIPSFRKFLNTLDMDKLSYDIGTSSTKRLQTTAPFTEEQQKYIADAIFAQTTALLGQYHAWIAEIL